MLRIGRQSEVGMRLPKMSQIPSSEDLHFLLSKAQRNWRQAVELSFKSSLESNTYTIVVQCEMETGMPQWGLFLGEEADAQLIWTHATADVSRIYDLIDQACLNKQTQATAQAQTRAIQEYDDKAVQTTTNYTEPAGSAIQTSGHKGTLETPALDQSAIASVISLLSRPETGIFTFPAFQFFLEQEHLRFQRGGLPFSIIIFEMYIKNHNTGGNYEPLPLSAVRNICSQILSMKRNIDLLAHERGFAFACLLPHTEAAGAVVFARRIEGTLKASEHVPGMADDDIAFFFGVASTPPDSTHPGELLSAAHNAKETAKETTLAQS